MKVNGKVFIVTGSGNGVGRELVLLLLQKGAHVAAVDINEQGLLETKRLAKEFSHHMSLHCLDITDPTKIKDLPEQVIAVHGWIDGLINCAGIIHRFEHFKDMKEETIQKVMNVNFFGTIQMTKTVLPYLVKQKTSHITIISSMGALFSVPGQIMYGASKAGLKLFAEGLRSELKPNNVRIMAVFPGGINSNIMGNSGVLVSSRMEKLRKIFKLLTPIKAAKKIIRHIERNTYRLTLGFDAKAIDILSRMSPTIFTKWIYAIMDRLINGPRQNKNESLL